MAKYRETDENFMEIWTEMGYYFIRLTKLKWTTQINRCSLGICYEGGLNEQVLKVDTRTPQQKAAIYELLKQLHRDYPKARIIGHRDLPHVAKDCPCYSMDKCADLQPKEW